MKNNNLKYLIAGTGGVGGSIAAFLALAGKDVTCIARGGHLAALRENGLKLHSDLKGEHTLDVPAYTAEEYAALASSADAYKADVIFRMRQRLFRRLHYGINQARRTQGHGSNPHPERPWHRSAHPAAGSRRHGTGRLHLHRRIRIRQMAKSRKWAKIFRLVYGAHKDTIVSRETLAAIQRICRKAASRPTYLPTSTATPSSNGLSSRPWPLPELTTTCLWAKCRSPAKYATPSSGFRKKARPWDGNWASGSRKTS